MLNLFICTHLLHNNICSWIPFNLNIVQFDLLFIPYINCTFLYYVSLLQFNCHLIPYIPGLNKRLVIIHMIYPLRSVMCITCVEYRAATYKFSAHSYWWIYPSLFPQKGSLQSLEFFFSPTSLSCPKFLTTNFNIITLYTQIHNFLEILYWKGAEKS